MKIWTSEYTFNHPWEIIARAAWRKDSNPINTAILGTDVLDRQVINGILHSHRLVITTWGVPNWLKIILGPTNVFYASEHSTVDPVAKRIIFKTKNITFNNYIAVNEVVHYEPHSQKNGKTILKQEAVIEVDGLPFKSYVEDLVYDTVIINANKSKQVIEWVIENIKF